MIAQPKLKAAVAILLLGVIPCSALAGGGPPMSDQQRRALRRQQAVEQRILQRWQRRGARAIPALIAVAFNCKHRRRGLQLQARELLALQGTSAINAIYRTRIAPCVPWDAACTTAKAPHRSTPCDPPDRAAAKAELLASLYCENLDPDQSQRVFTAWGRYLGRAGHPRHKLALRALRQVIRPMPPAECGQRPLCGAPHRVNCNHRALNRVGPDLIRLLQATPPAKTALRQAIVRALGAGKVTAAVPTLQRLYRRGQLRREVVMSLARIQADPQAGAAAQREALDYLRTASKLRDQAAALYALDTLGAHASRAAYTTLQATARRGIATLAAAKLNPHQRSAWDSTAPDAVLWYVVALADRARRHNTALPGLPKLLLAIIRSAAVGHTRYEAAKLLLAHPAQLNTKQRTCARDVLARRRMPPDRGLLALLRSKTPARVLQNAVAPQHPPYDTRRVAPSSCK